MSNRFHALLTNFSFGEVTPRLSAQVGGGNVFGMSADDVYRSGCRELTNMVVMEQGGVYKREGFRYARDLTVDIPAPSAAADGASYRMFTLKTVGEDVLLLIVPGMLFIYNLPEFTIFYATATPYTLSDLRGIGVTQWERNVVVFSAAHRPRLLRFDTTFEFVDPGVDFVAPLYPYHDSRSPIPQEGSWQLDIPESTFSPGTTTSAGFAVSGIPSRDAAGGLAEAYVSLDGGLTASNIQDNLNFYNAAVVAGTAEVTYDGTTGTIMHYTVNYQFKSTVGDTTGALTSPFTATLLVNGQSGAEPLWSGPLLVPHAVNYYECLSTHTSNAANEPGVGSDWGLYWADRGVSIPTDKDYDVATVAWSLEQAYSPRNRGWPPQMTFHEQRLVGSGPVGALSVIAATRLTSVPDLFNFTLGPNDDDGLLYRLASGTNCIIRWLLSSGPLFIGTSSGVFVQLARPWTPTNVDFDRINGYASSLTLRAIEVDGDVFFPTVDDRQLRVLNFINDLQAWNSFNLCVFGEHLLTDARRFRQLVSHQGHETYLWAVRTDGVLLGMTYSPGQSVFHSMGWHKHAISDPVIEIAPAFDGSRYILIALVNRYVRGSSGLWERHPTLEYMEQVSRNLFDAEPTMFPGVDGGGGATDFHVDVYGPDRWSVHLDSYSTLTGGGAALALPPRFSGRLVGIVEDGQFLGFFTAGANTVPVVTKPGAIVHVGFGYTSRIEPNRFEAGTAMTSQSQSIRWTKPFMRLLTSAMPKLNGVRHNERLQDARYDDATGLVSGDAYLVNYGADGKLVIEQDLPLPLHLLGIFGLMTTEEG